MSSTVVIEQALARAAERAGRPLPAWLVPHLAQEVAHDLAAVPTPGPPRTKVTLPNGTRLTGRQRQIAALFAEGLTNHEIGTALHLAEDTVKTHARRLCAAMGAYNRAHAAALATRWGLANPKPLPTKESPCRLSA